MSLDQFPTRDENSELAVRAESEFEQAIVAAVHFVVQQRDRHDYGTDFQLEAKQFGSMTNYRVHIQLKGTEKTTNLDGSVSISVPRTNLTYMLSQPNSCYVCYHAPTDRLLYRSAEDVFRDAEHRGEAWRSQATVTIRFHSELDEEFQTRLCKRVVASSKTNRDDRLGWVTSTPEQFPERVVKDVPTIVVPESRDEAFEVLRTLYERNNDEVISKAFEQFVSSLGHDNPQLQYAYLSEINLAMRHVEFDRDRVAHAIEFLKAIGTDDAPELLYCLANAHCAIGDQEEAKRLYREAIRLATDPTLAHLAAQCWKNFGAEIENEGDFDEARRCYEKALQLAPQLMEAHMALAHIHREAGELKKALHHLDQVVWAVDDVGPTLAARGRRIEVQFLLGNADRAFDDIVTILPYAEREQWILPCCARLVYDYARANDSSIERAIRFWDAFLRLKPNDAYARRERLLCLAYAKMHGHSPGIDYHRYLSDVTKYQADQTNKDPLLWDRTGHWAQLEGEWAEAESQYRKAFNLESDRYGYCLGTALNFLNRYEEALPILLDQANKHQPDAFSWFQVAVAQEGVGEYRECEESYRRALALDPDFELAMFNLGGVLWNHGTKVDGIQVWIEALERFPTHPLAEKLRQQLPIFAD